MQGRTAQITTAAQDAPAAFKQSSLHVICTVY